ncbi:MAG: putative Fe-S oxidoreductase [Candidatus Amesbacteria bacterium GW2011_GWB1_47_19]|nr:MAG: putative Fe-S oxidoreductase [Candidatus Amesbacteria bacterium GW2011_GWA1_44_24]KKU31941.1 MAG: Arylsulfatase regulator (Fe-S oxidoreductase) [Candidatus Amesbacteria bacterium GW2011_GWC1_46_24]KKU66877.1 MAG: putative Fe-S oxidoreductase [Candidatus Amesbacteria bacterium GW2011_GWB1_47_19]OGD05642.1 MAG: hypothetical protein A2379_00430 [Candidatus Amesbacteria bacterium RIFOXYB1_FULL_47_13]HBC72218.1 hypothetical protein [Candidatus Amesbacteria bacterium]
MDQQFEIQADTAITPEKNISGFFSRLHDKLKSAPIELVQTARLKIRNNNVLYAIPGHESWLPLLKLAASEFSSFITYGRTDMPLAVGVETVASCTRKCSYCPVSKQEFPETRPYRVMRDEIYNSIIDTLSEIPRRANQKGFNGVLHLNGYGEPTIDKKIVQRTEYARKKLPEATIGFYSNGDNLTEDLYLQLRNVGINEIIMTPHDGKFSSRLQDLGEKYFEDGILKLNPPLTKLSNRGGNINVAEALLQSPTNRCVHPSFTMEITVDGTTILCASDALIKTPLGNISKSGFHDVWDNKYYRQMRRALRHGKYDLLPEICRRCRIPN